MQFFQKIRWRKTCARVKFGPSKIDERSIVTVLVLFRSTRYAQNHSSCLNVQDMCKIIQLNVDISNTHWRWNSVCVIEGNMSVSQGGCKLQIAQVSKGFEFKL